jgi:sulfite reductase (NADPH) flavoprotein alpha-component
VFYYFGYGSNLSVIALRAKGVVPLRSEPAILEGWRLTFNVPDFFPIEGGTGNIEPGPDDTVHGVLHACRDRDFASLDRLEALGVTYDRIVLSVMTYDGRRRSAYVYVGIAANLDNHLCPSERYRNILARGAVDMRLDPAYVDRLLAIPTLQRPLLSSFRPPPGASLRHFTLDTLSKEPSLTSLNGYVFDMSAARREHAYLQELLAGKDVTLFFLKRLDTSDGTESFEDIKAGRLNEAQRSYLNAYLHEFAREYRLVGRIHYDSETPSFRDVVLPAVPDSGKRATRLSSRPPRPLVSVARAVLERAEAARAALGHENLGFLSEACGFMPRDAPREGLPPAFAAWDQAAANLPYLYRSLRLRRELDHLPVLDADAESLPDGALLRAAMVLSMLSHAYWYVETHPPERLPPALAKPWQEVRARLGRGPAVLTYIDLIVYNWKLVDPRDPDPMRVENMRLLVPTVDTNEERTFYLTQAEILARCSPVVGAVVRAQEAVLDDDPEALESCLITIGSCLQTVVRDSLLKINPNPAGATHVDPVIWAKTVAPFAVPMQGGVQGPSGTSSPIFNTLDVFFRRDRFQTFLGREIQQLRDTYPPAWRELLVALSEVSVPAYVERTNNANLKGLLREVVTTYAGENGFLGRHRMKVYGYLELAFKVGRSVTIGGFKGVFKDRTWDLVDTELEKSRQERAQSFPPSCHHVKVKSVTPPDPRHPSHVSHVVLDISGTGLQYEVGDRCGILPENSPELIERTLAALSANDDERIVLTPEWREAIRLRWGYDERSTTLTLREVLRFGHIRPVLPRVAEALHALTQNAALKERIVGRTTHLWELWDLLQMLKDDGFDTRRLWQRNGQGQPQHICAVIPPQAFRMYSISSSMTSARTGEQQELHLTVGRLRYESKGSGDGPPIERYGTASSFLAAAADRKAPVSIIIQHPPRFSLPKSSRAPIIMIAGGTGLSPFRAFIAERLRQQGAAEAWLFVALRSRADFIYGDELAPAVRSGLLKLRVCFSRDDADLMFEPDGTGGRFLPAPGKRRRIQDILLEEDTARTLWDMLRRGAHDGTGAHVYVCGRSAFASAAMQAIKEIVRRFASGNEQQREVQAERTLAELMAQGRLMEEIFSGHTDEEALDEVDCSDLAEHNDDEVGHWIAIHGSVYDVTEFIRRHPGGARVLQGYCGMDGTDGYERTHAGRSEIDAMRQMYAVGKVRRIDFGGASGVVQGPSGPQTISLSAAHRVWVKLLYLVVEMQNALRNDHSLQDGVTARGDPARPRSLYKLQRSVETHERFLRSYLDVLVSESLPNLWTITQGLFGPDESPLWMKSSLATLEDGYAARHNEAMIGELFESIRRITNGPSDIVETARIAAACDALEREDGLLLAAVKRILLTGVRAFERFGADVRALGASTLIQSCRELPVAVEHYHQRLLAALTDDQWRPVVSVRTQRNSDADEFKVTLTTRHYVIEEDERHGVAILRRTPVPFDSVEDITAANDKVIEHFRPHHKSYGIVVDMRQAPTRNDPAFENAMSRLRAQVGEVFARVAVLIESSVGVLQVDRLGRAEGGKTFATQSESAATRFARGHS